MDTNKRPQISFSFQVQEEQGYRTIKLLGTEVRNEVVPDDRNPVEFLCERLMAELQRVVPGFTAAPVQ